VSLPKDERPLSRYIDAFFLDLNWDEVNHRLDRGLAASKAFRG
jgi:hypothetical protein